jgi:hypothetical protein
MTQKLDLKAKLLPPFCVANSYANVYFKILNKLFLEIASRMLFRCSNNKINYEENHKP